MDKLFSVVALIALLAGGGYLNYQRNAYLDEDAPARTYATLSDAQIEQLIAAYEGELYKATEAVDDKSDPSALLDGYRAGDLTGRVEAFDRFQDQNKDWKSSYRHKVEQEVMIEALRREQQLRGQGMDQEWRRILRRVVTL
jgi:hypothetical protein